MASDISKTVVIRGFVFSAILILSSNLCLGVGDDYDYLGHGIPGVIKDVADNIIKPKRTVLLINDIGKDVTLTVHCKSGDDDLGVRKIAYRREWGFKFRPNYWGTTLFYCRFSWGRQSRWFDVYDQVRDRGADTEMQYLVRTSGLCRLHVIFEPGCEKWQR